MRFTLTCISVLIFQFSNSAFASETEPPFERGLDLIHNELRIARSGIRALSIAAHPDDEDGGTLAYLRRTLGVETHMCLFTRGEGGQNESGPELGADLAVLRTRETESAAKILGAKVWYLNLPDFGYAKYFVDTTAVWRDDVPEERLTRIIRLVRPHIIFTNHDQGGTDHGHHQAAGYFTNKAMKAAANPEKYVEQMKEDGTKPWQVQKLYLRRFQPLQKPKNADPQPSCLHIDISQRDLLSGLSASEIGAFALTRHFSQGMQRNLLPGEHEMRYMELYRTLLTAPDSSMISGIKSAHEFVDPKNRRGLFNKQMDEVFEKLLNATALENGSLVKAIVNAAAELGENEDERASLAHVDRALAEALGLKIAASTDDPVTTYDETVKVSIRVVNTGKMPVKLDGVKLLRESEKWEVSVPDIHRELKAGASETFGAQVAAREGAFPTFPHAQHIWSRSESRMPLQATASFTISAGENKYTLRVTQPVPLDLVPPRTAKIVPDPVLIFDDPAHNDNHLVVAKFKLAVTNHRKVKEPTKLFIGMVPKANAPVDSFTLTFNSEDETQSEEFRFLAPVEDLNKGDVLVDTQMWTAQATSPGPVARLRRIPVKLPTPLHVGIVKTYDDATLTALRNMERAGLGLDVTELSDDDLRTADLNKLHTIILDIRATQYRPEVRRARERLMQFMRDGGNVVCMYHKDFDWNPRDKDPRGVGIFRGESGGGEIAPYPIELSFARVTDENAPVKILNPLHPLMLEPCKIWERDFQGWVQERAVYMPKSWSREYTPLLSSRDGDEPAQDGGLLIANVEQGTFMYCSYVLYRQLRAGNPGGYRLLSNMIAYPRVKRRN